MTDNPTPAEPPIKWTLDGDKTCGYNNWLGETPFGRILITWKGWKEDLDACVDEFPGGFNSYGAPDDVKAACEAEFARRAALATPAEPLRLGAEPAERGGEAMRPKESGHEESTQASAPQVVEPQAWTTQAHIHAPTHGKAGYFSKTPDTVWCVPVFFGPARSIDDHRD